MKRFGLVSFAVVALGAGLCAQPPNQVVSAGYQFPRPQVSYGQIITLFVRGLNATDGMANTLPLPTSISGISVAVKNPPHGYPSLLPMLSVHPSPLCGSLAYDCDITAVTVQIPTEPLCIPSGFANDCTFGPQPVITISVEQNATGQEFQFSVLPRSPQPHILNQCDTIMGQFGGCYPMITHANNHLISTGEPAHTGETIVVYAVGLGLTTPSVKSGVPAPSPGPVADLFIPITLSFELDLAAGSPPPPPLWVPTGQWLQPSFAGLVPGFVGLYQINLKLPDTLPQGTHQCQAFLDTNTRILLGDGLSEGTMTDVETADICVQP